MHDGGFYSDLALERRRLDREIAGIDYKREVAQGGIWERITVRTEEAAESIGRPKGIYDTLTLDRMDRLTPTEIDDAKEEIAKELCLVFERENISPARILALGLGNGSLTPDAIGPRTVAGIFPTLQMSRADYDMFEEFECSEIAAIAPGVESTSGISAREVAIGVCKMIEPDVIIAIDALASRSPERLGTTIQISTTGIFPGSGVGNHKQAIDAKSLGAPVIAIGVPTVISSALLTQRAKEKKQPSYNMLVSPKEIDGIVKSAAEIISGGINQAFGILY